MRNQQLELMHDSFGEALRAIAMHYGSGRLKKMAAELWPTMKIEDAARKLSHCLDADRAEKLTLEEVETILIRGREIGVHYGMTYLCRSAGYEDPEPLEPEDERAKLQREFIEASKRFEVLAKRMESLSNG